MKKLVSGCVLGLSILGLGTVAFSGCGSGGSSGGGQPVIDAAPPPTATLNVSVTFPDDASQTTTASVHVWAVASKAETGSVSCSSLIGGDLDPYDLSLERRADVATEPAKLPASASNVETGPAAVYVEAVGYDGVVELAGCVPVDVVLPSTDVTVTLTKAGVFDCTDPATKDGAPCDDGKRCTIGEKCSNGSCKGGVARDCSHLADGCNAGTCDETLGCISTPVPDGTPCDDELYCTKGDICTAGACGGSPLDCPPTGAPCEVIVGCDESLDQCVYDDAAYGTPCDDTNFCTINDQCSSYGSCNGSPRDCSQVADQCNDASCDEATDSCKPIPKASYYSCNDTFSCTTSDHCDGLGKCVGTAKSCTYLNDQCNTGTCQEPGGGCIKTPVANGTTCNDNNPATLNDVCTNGVCAGT